MVNTFVTHPDFSTSAKYLDRRRLLKQCVEAYQILNIIEQLYTIAKLCQWEDMTPVNIDETTYPINMQVDNYKQRIEWLHNTRKKYLKLDYRYVCIDNVIRKVPKDELPYKINKSYKFWDYHCDHIVIWTKDKLTASYANQIDSILFTRCKKPYIPKNKWCYIIERQHVCLPQDTIYSLGFSQHAIVKMWIGYQSALKSYINAHILEYRTRVKNDNTSCNINMDIYDLPDAYPMPWWINSNDIINTHRASLLRKEQHRHEPPHYINNDIFTSIDEKYKQHGYIWPGSLPAINHVHLLMSSCHNNCGDIDLDIVCSPINNG